MTGSRSTPARHSDRSSFDALSRTIEGLEARIEGLMGATAVRHGRPAAVEATGDRPARASLPPSRDAGSPPRSNDPLSEIRERQRMLDAVRRQPSGTTPNLAAEDHARHDFERLTARLEAGAAYRPRPDAPAMGRPERASPSARSKGAEPLSAMPMSDIAQALVGLRQDLKREISEGVAREMQSVRSEMRAIRAAAEDQHFNQDIQTDLARLAQGIDQLALKATPETDALRAEFDELRSVMEGLAREESLLRMQNQWQSMEERIHDTDPAALREELVSLAYRIDDIRNQLGVMADSPVIRALEQKLLHVAGAMEQLGSRMQPNDAALAEQFGLLDQRLDEISRAIAAGSRSNTPSLDTAAFQRLEGRLAALTEHVESIAAAPSHHAATDALSSRIEMLAAKIEDLSEEQAAARLEERIDQLAVVIRQASHSGSPADLTGYLSDISRKIDALDQQAVGDGLGERLDYLARRIDEMEYQPQHRPLSDESLERIEDRLSDIAMRLDQASAAPRGDDDALRSLENQIAHLSTLIAQPGSGAMPPELEGRMASIESYMATNDEYIIEAARQAAEAVVEAYSRNIGAAGSATDMAALSALADDLRHLEELTRGAESRTHDTFDALHGTLVQIAGRLDSLEDRIAASVTLAAAPREAGARPAAAIHAAASGGSNERQEPAGTISAAMATGLLEPAQQDDRMQAEDGDRREDAIVAPAAALPAEIEARSEKTSLLAGLKRRFLSSGRQDSAPIAARTLIEPSPSIDPSDVLPPERENDLLEPGSGAPDVKKILERVRASQAAGEFERDRTGDRADYIAAARRAARAAAQETDPSQNAAAGKGLPKAAAKRDAKAKAGKTETAFARNRRPILMAVGAVLLALMALPLAKTVMAPKAPQVAVVQAPVAAKAQATKPAEPTGAAPVTTTEQAVGMADDAALPAPSAPKPEPALVTAAGVMGEASAGAEPGASPAMAPSDSIEEPSVSAQAATEAPVAAPAVTPAEPVAAAITVPAGIEPKSLAEAAAAGDANALFEIGARFSEGRGVKADPTEAAKWYRLAADRGLAPAQYRVGNMLEKGTGIARNLGEAVTYYRRAAEAGNASAMHNLAVLHASGAVGQADYAAAVEWFRNAAELGVADSQFNLAILYARGNGVKQDLEESYKWFGVAAKAGDADAAQKRDEVANAMRKEQLESARAKLDGWTAKPLDPKANAVQLPDEWSGAKPLTTSSVDMEKAIRNIQAILTKNGFDAGTPDGKLGAKTVAAIKAFQNSIGQEPTGKVNDELVRELLARNK